MEKLNETESKQKTIFLLGAGASVDAGVPDTYTFVEDFCAYIHKFHPSLFMSLEIILLVRERFNKETKLKKTVDVEQLLDTLRRLISRLNDPLLYFYSDKVTQDLRHEDYVALERLLQNYIRKRVIIEDETRLEYLKEFFKFEKPLEIYSTNYDTCIEQLCYLHHRLYADGFDINWNERNFKDFSDVKHYKMHGSVIWYQNTKTKECVKIPVNAFMKKNQ